MFRRLFALCAATLLVGGLLTPQHSSADPVSVVARTAPGDPRLGVAESYVNSEAAWTLGAAQAAASPSGAAASPPH